MDEKIKILLYSSNIWYLGEGMLGPLFTVFTQRIGGSLLDVSWAWALYMIVTGVLVMVFGKMSDKMSKEKMMVLGYVLNTVFTFGYLFVSTTAHMFIVQIGLGVAAALSIPTWSALYAKYENKKKSGYLWGLASGEYRIITGIAIIIGGLIVNYFSFSALFILMGMIQIVATIYQARILSR